MRTNDLLLRCYAERTDGVWSAICLDLNLASQGDTLADARSELNEQIVSYLDDSRTGSVTSKTTLHARRENRNPGYRHTRSAGRGRLDS